MTIEFFCQQCGRKVTAPDGAEGKRAKCLTCGAIIFIPSPDGRRFSGLDDPSLEIPAVEPPPSAPRETPPAAAPARPTAGSSSDSVAGKTHLADVSDLLQDADQTLNKPQPAPANEGAEGLDFVLEAADYDKYKPKRDEFGRPISPPKKKPPAVPASRPAPVTPPPPPSATPPPLQGAAHPQANGGFGSAAQMPPPPRPVYPRDAAAAAAQPIAMAPVIVGPAPVVVQKGSLIEDCLGAFVYGLRNFGAILVLVILLFLASVGLFLIALFFGITLSQMPWAMLLVGLGFLVIFTALSGWQMSLQVGIIDITIHGGDDTPALPQWDFNDHFKLGLQLIGLIIVYVLPVVTLPLLPLGILALGYTGDGRAFDLVWAVKSAFKRPGQLILVWVSMIAYAIAVALLYLPIALICGTIAGPDPGVTNALFSGLIERFSYWILSGLYYCMCSRCIGSLGRRCPDLTNSIAPVPNPAISIAFLSGGVALTIAFYAMLAVTVAGLGSMLSSSGQRIFMPGTQSSKSTNDQPQAWNPGGGPAPSPAPVILNTEHVRNLTAEHTSENCIVTMGGRSKSTPAVSTSQKIDFSRRDMVMDDIRRVLLVPYIRFHRQMPSSFNELLAAERLTADRFTSGFSTNYVVVPLVLSQAQGSDIVIYSDTLLYSSVYEVICLDGEIKFVWADELQTQLAQESQRRNAFSTPAPPVIVSTPSPGPTYSRPPIYSTPPAVNWSSQEQDLIALADALKTYALSKSGKLPESVDELLKDGLKASAAVSAADSQTPMALLSGKFDRNSMDVLAYDPLPVKDGAQAGKIRFIRTAGNPEYLASKDFEAELHATRAKAHLRAFWQILSAFNEKNRRPPIHLDEMITDGLAKDDAAVRGLGDSAPKYVVVADATWNSNDLIAFDPHPYGTRYIALTADGDVRTYTSLNTITAYVERQKEEKARLAEFKRVFGQPTPPAGQPAKPVPGIVEIGGKKLIVDWPVEGWQEVDQHLFKEVCQVVRKVTTKEGTATVGFAVGPEAKDKNDKAFQDYRKELVDLWVKKMRAKTVKESTQPIGDITYDRINSTEGAITGMIFVGVRQGRCVSYWYVSNTTNLFKPFADAFDKVTIKEEKK